MNSISSVFSKSLSLKLNTTTLVIQNLLGLVVGLFTTSLLIRTMGISNYGVFTVFNSTTLIFTIFSASASISVQRFIGVAISEDSNNVNRILVNALVIQFLVSALILFLTFILNEFMYSLFFIGSEIEYSTFVKVYYFFLAQFIVKILFIPFEAYVFAKQKIVYISIISILELIFRFLAVYSLQFFSVNPLVLLSILYFGITFIIVFIKIFTIVRIERISFNYILQDIDFSLLRRMINFSLWSYVGVFGGVFNNYGPIFLTSYFFNSNFNAAQGINSQISSQIPILSNQFLRNANPKIMSSKNKPYLFMSFSNISYFLVLPFAIFMFFNIENVLKIWLTDFPVVAIDIIKLSLLLVVINQIMSPLINVLRKINKVKFLELSTLIFQFLPIGISFVFFAYNMFDFISMYYTIVIFNCFRLFVVYALLIKFELIPTLALIKSIFYQMLQLFLSFSILYLLNLYLPFSSVELILFCNVIIIICVSLVNFKILKSQNETYQTVLEFE